MKHLSRFQVLFAAGIFCLGLVANARAYADTYELFPLATDTSVPYGIDDAGTVVVQLQGGTLYYDATCGPTAPACFRTYVFGELAETSITPPSFEYDNGTSCTVPGAIAAGFNAVCNNGRELFSENLAVFTGAPSNLVTLVGGQAYDGMINSMGDVLFADGSLSATYEAVDLTSRLGMAPEPTSLVLIATGVLSFAGATRRRWLAGL